MIGSEHLEVRETSIPGARIVVPRALSDDRGFFKETYVRSKYRALEIVDDFVQDSMSMSSRNVLRGLHADPAMSKLVHVLHGEVFDVIADARKDSPAFGRWESVRLTAANHLQIYIPAGCLHGFLVLSEDAIFCYKQSAEYAPQREIGVRWDDPFLAIEWPNLGSPPIVSARDRNNRSFTEAFAV